MCGLAICVEVYMQEIFEEAKRSIVVFMNLEKAYGRVDRQVT
jgi:hypothetical protein